MTEETGLPGVNQPIFGNLVQSVIWLEIAKMSIVLRVKRWARMSLGPGWYTLWDAIFAKFRLAEKLHVAEAFKV